MKRSSWFKQWFNKLDFEEKIGFFVGVIIGVVVGIIIFLNIDEVPATEIDYKELEDKVIAIQENPELLFEMDCDISIKDDVITVTIENNECSLTVQYLQNFKTAYISGKDNSIPWIFALGFAILVGILIYIISFFVVTMIVYVFKDFVLNRRNSKPKKA